MFALHSEEPASIEALEDSNWQKNWKQASYWIEMGLQSKIHFRQNSKKYKTRIVAKRLF